MDKSLTLCGVSLDCTKTRLLGRDRNMEEYDFRHEMFYQFLHYYVANPAKMEDFIRHLQKTRDQDVPWEFAARRHPTAVAEISKYVPAFLPLMCRTFSSLYPNHAHLGDHIMHREFSDPNAKMDISFAEILFHLKYIVNRKVIFVSDSFLLQALNHVNKRDVEVK